MLLTALSVIAKPLPFCLDAGQTVKISSCQNEAPIVKTALGILEHDLNSVLANEVKYVQTGGNIIIGTFNKDLKKYFAKDEV